MIFELITIQNSHLLPFFRLAANFMALAEGMCVNAFSRFLANRFLSVFIVFILIETIILELLLQPLGTPAHN